MAKSVKQKVVSKKPKIRTFVEDVKPSEEKLQEIRETLRLVRDTKHRLDDLGSVMSAERDNLTSMRYEVLPELFLTAGVDNIGLPEEGNNPAYDCKLKPFYQANIAASWDEERREAAFKYLESIGAGSLIKTNITIFIDRTDHKKRKLAIAALKKLKLDHEIGLAVSHQTLTAFLKEQTEAGVILDLNKIGGQIGQVVELRERKERKAKS
jgi:hypothetical protein